MLAFEPGIKEGDGISLNKVGRLIAPAVKKLVDICARNTASVEKSIIVLVEKGKKRIIV